MESDARLVKDIEHAHQRAADLGRKADALALAAAERSRAARKGQITQSHALEEVEPLDDLLKNLRTDDALLFGQLEVLHKCDRVRDALLAEVGDVDAADRDGKALLAQTLTAACVAGNFRHVGADLVLDPVRRGLAVAALEVRDHALERRFIGALAVD